MAIRMIWTEIKLLAREPLTLLLSLAFPILLLVLLAYSYGNDPNSAYGGIGETDFYVPVYAAATIAVMGFLGVPTHLAAYRERGVLRRFRAAGVRASVLLAAQVVITALIVTVGSGAMVAMGFGAFDLREPKSAGAVVLAFLIGTVAFAALGVLLGSLLPTSRAAQGLGLLLFFGLFFISGGGPPPEVLPDEINTLVDFTPMGPLVDAVSQPWHQGGSDVVALVALGAIAVVSAVLATLRINRT